MKIKEGKYLVLEGNEEKRYYAVDADAYPIGSEVKITHYSRYEWASTKQIQLLKAANVDPITAKE